MTTAVPVSDIQQSVSLALSEDLGGLSPSEGDITANLDPVRSPSVSQGDNKRRLYCLWSGLGEPSV